MSLHKDLMEQAEHLARREIRRPKQASLRRAVSAAYYALFHLINNSAAWQIAPDVPPEINHQIQRWFDHAEMKRVCGRFLAVRLSKPLSDLVGPVASVHLQTVARAFIDVQEARHRADYDLGWVITRDDALNYVNIVWDAFEAWEAIRKSAEANIFILSLFVWEKWEKRRS